MFDHLCDILGDMVLCFNGILTINGIVYTIYMGGRIVHRSQLAQLGGQVDHRASGRQIGDKNDLI